MPWQNSSCIVITCQTRRHAEHDKLRPDMRDTRCIFEASFAEAMYAERRTAAQMPELHCSVHGIAVCMALQCAWHCTSRYKSHHTLGTFRRELPDLADAVLAVLQQSLAGWEALETDLLEAANLQQQAAELGDRVRSATQVIVDAVLQLLDAGAFRQCTVCICLCFVTCVLAPSALPYSHLWIDV